MHNKPSNTTNYCNAEALRNYPEAIRTLPFCVWRMEQVGERLTKMPYNPKTGFRAAVDNMRTFSDLETAIDAMASNRYNGVGVNISGNVGSIDVDKCVSVDGTLSETAETILALFPEAHVEYSPSGHGLHLRCGGLLHQLREIWRRNLSARRDKALLDRDGQCVSHRGYDRDGARPGAIQGPVHEAPADGSGTGFHTKGRFCPVRRGGLAPVRHIPGWPDVHPILPRGLGEAGGR